MAAEKSKENSVKGTMDISVVINGKQVKKWWIMDRHSDSCTEVGGITGV